MSKADNGDAPRPPGRSATTPRSTPPIAAVPAPIQADALVTAIEQDQTHPFDGPVENKAGETVVPNGENIKDSDLLQMSYYVKGVDGSLPG